MVVDMITGTAGTKNIAPDLRISEMSWKIVSKKRKKKSNKNKKGKNNV